MKEKTLLINDYVSIKKGVAPQDGQPILDDIIKYLEQGDKVILDFDGMELLTTAFLNVVIGNLYKNYTSEQLKKHLDFKNCDELTPQRIKRVIDTAKQFYKDYKSFDKTFNEVVYRW